jgi:hypothetical protein
MPTPAENRYDFSPRSRLEVSASRVGKSREPVLFIDEVLRRPQDLVDYAAREVEFTPAWTAHGGYPGIRAPAPLNYVDSLVRALAPVIEGAFALGGARLARAACYFSMVTLAPEKLTGLQRIPHIDTANPLRIALLHYLCDARLGGTAFYRHRASGLETISPEQETSYLRARDRELAGQLPAPDYVRGDSRTYRQIAEVEARFNRVLIYRSCLLHSGMIPKDMNFSPDPRKGRLTTTVLVSYAAD